MPLGLVVLAHVQVAEDSSRSSDPIAIPPLPERPIPRRFTGPGLCRAWAETNGHTTF